MTPRERVENVLLRRGPVDRVPFTIYEGLMPRCTCERQLRDDGLCLIGSAGVFGAAMPNVKEHSDGFFENGEYKVRWYLETPVGTVYTVNVPKALTTWHEQFMFKTPEDYATCEFIVRDTVYTPNYAGFLRYQEEKGPDFHCRTGIGYEPMQHIITAIMGVETFCVEWMERRDEVLKLYDAVVASCRKRYQLIAESPCLAVNYGGNVSPEVIGLERFEKYYVPNYNEAAEILHKHGKLIGCHLDANNRLLAPAVAETGLDYIEAFTPPPDCDLSVKEALALWPDKILWINFPSSVHLAKTEVVRETTRQLLREAGTGDRFIIGVTEDMPPETYQQSMTAIGETINKYGQLPMKN